jgi:hypothetical protein
MMKTYIVCSYANGNPIAAENGFRAAQKRAHCVNPPFSFCTLDEYLSMPIDEYTKNKAKQMAEKAKQKAEKAK